MSAVMISSFILPALYVHSSALHLMSFIALKRPPLPCGYVGNVILEAPCMLYF